MKCRGVEDEEIGRTSGGVLRFGTIDNEHLGMGGIELMYQIYLCFTVGGLQR